MKQVLKHSLIVFFAFFLSGCKLHVATFEGGYVRSELGDCYEGTTCIYDISDNSFNVSFQAIPRQQHFFVRWDKGTLCSESTSPTCTVSGANLNPEVFESETIVGHLRPIFERNWHPPEPYEITDTIIVDGKEWAQPDLFALRDVYWAQVNAACPYGVCREDAVVADYKLAGWTWASHSDVEELFAHYFGSEYFGPMTPNSRQEEDSEWAPAFFDEWGAFLAPSWFNVFFSSIDGSQVGRAVVTSPVTGIHTAYITTTSIDASDMGPMFYRPYPP